MIPLKGRKQTVTTINTRAFEQSFNNIGIPKTVNADQKSDFKNYTF